MEISTRTKSEVNSKKDREKKTSHLTAHPVNLSGEAAVSGMVVREDIMVNLKVGY